MTDYKDAYQLVRQYAAKVDHELRSDDPRLDASVMLQHKDGSQMFWQRAFAMCHFVKDHDLLFYMIFTEHHGWYVYDSADVKVFAFSSRVAIPFRPEDQRTTK